MPPILLRVLVLSHTYLQPAHRGKLRALAARGLEVTVAIPQRWREPWFGRPIDVAWERQGGLEVFPLPAHGMGPKGELEKATYGRRALKALLRDRRPDLVQIEEEPTTPAARQVLAAARRLAIPVVLFTRQNVDLELGWWARWKHRRMLRRLTGLVAGSDLAGSLARHDAPNLPIAVIPQLGALAPHEPQHVPHEGLAIGFIGRLVRNKGIDNLLEALALQRDAKWRLTIVGDGPERVRLERLAMVVVDARIVLEQRRLVTEQGRALRGCAWTAGIVQHKGRYVRLFLFCLEVSGHPFKWLLINCSRCSSNR